MNSPDYTQYTLTELEDALAHVDREQYPERTQQILQEIEVRGATKSSQSKQHSPEFHEELHPNLFIRYWRGQVSLPMSYWGVGIATSVLIFAISKAVKLGIDSSTDTWQLGAYILGLYVFIIFAVVWQSVGLFRTARKHPLRTGDSGWATVAIVMLVIGLCSFSFQMYQTGFPIMKSGAQLIVGGKSTPSTQFRVLNQGKDLELIGNIELGSERLLEEQLVANPNVTRLHLHSNGGRVLAASRMLEIIKRYQLETYVKTECASACTLLFLAGKQRLLADEGKLKFHAPGIGGTSSHDIEELGQATKDAYITVGLPMWFIDRVMRTPNDQFWSPTHDELLKANVIDKVVDSSVYPISGLGPTTSITVEEIESGLLTSDYMVAMKEHDPDAYKKVVDFNLNGMLNGLSKSEITGQVSNLVYSERLPSYLSTASNEAMVEYWQSQIDQMKELKGNYPLACASLTYPDVVPQKNKYGNEGSISAAIQSQELAAIAKLIRTHNGRYDTIDESTKQELIQQVIAIVREQNEEYFNVLVSAKDFVSRPNVLCDASIALNEAFISFDVETSGKLLRSL